MTKFDLFIPKSVTLSQLNTKTLIVDNIEEKWYQNSDGYYTLDIPKTFRFPSWITLYPSNENEDMFIAIIQVSKTSRIHDATSFSSGIDDLCFNAEHLEDPLNKYTDYLLNTVGRKIEHPEATLPKEGVLHFSIGDENEFLMLLMGVVYDKLPKLTINTDKSDIELVKDYNNPSVPSHFVIGNMLHTRGLTKDELQELLTLYKAKHSPESEITLGDETSIKQLLALLSELSIYNEVVENVKSDMAKMYKRNIQSAVFDKLTNKAELVDFGGHYQGITQLIASYHADEFLEMTQEEKDHFIMTNFELRGAYYNTHTHYIPNNYDVRMYASITDKT